MRRDRWTSGLALVLTSMACVGSSTLPLHRMADVRFRPRCVLEQIYERQCPNHPYQCLGELPPGAELIGLIEATQDKPLEMFREVAAAEGGDVLVMGPYHQAPIRLGSPLSNPAHVYQRAAVVRLPPLEGDSCQGEGRK